MEQNDKSMGLGFEPMMDAEENLFVAVHAKLGMLSSSMVLPESMIPTFIDNLRNALADGHQERKKHRQAKNGKTLLGPDGQALSVPTFEELDRMAEKDREELRAKVLNAAKVKD